MPLFALSIFLSAFLLFQVQPMIGKAVLPWFGGTPAVWSTLMLVFQVLLTGGYAYATWLVRRVKNQAWVHLALLGAAAVFLAWRALAFDSPLLPSISATEQNTNAPVFEIIKALFGSVAFPFFLLAANGPLMQAWFNRIHPTRSYARLYGLSNLGSLLGLLSYPFLIEPNFTLARQGGAWSIGFVLFGVLVGWIALQSRRVTGPSQPVSNSVTPGLRLPSSLLLLWIVLSATASIFLLSVTNQISQEVAVIPFLWILPLTIYLLSFILTFSSDRGYHRKLYAILFMISLAGTLFVMLNATSVHVYWQILAYSFLLFTACMLCHGELYLMRPAAEHLTTFYLMVSVGGAFGGLFVSLAAPVIFNGYWEFFVGLAMTVAILLTILRGNRDNTARARFVVTIFILVTLTLSIVGSVFSGALFARRNFYGVIRVQEAQIGNPPQPVYMMSHGITVHGLQFIDPTLRDRPTTYYVQDGGAGLAILNHPRYGSGLRVGMLGVGAGTLVAYAQPGDDYRLYEINPAVIDLAAGDGGYFSFLQDSDAKITLVPGDARITLQHELDLGQRQQFDVLVLDTFSSDSIPVHLVTREAFALYLAHLADDGVIAAHITNLHLDLQPVFWQLANHYGLNMARINYEGDQQGGYASHWILLSRHTSLLNTPIIQERAIDLSGYSTNVNIWTDDYSNLFQILK